MADTYLQLGDFIFSGLEIPESLALGGAQALVTHKFPGGARNVQAMGPDHDAIGWSGLFLGQTALDRAKYLDFLRVQGLQLQLTFFDSSYTVVIQRFRFFVERFYKVGYSIELEVVADNAQPVQTIAPSGFDAAIRADCDSLMGLAPSIGDSILTSAIGTLDTAIRGVSSFASAATSTIQGVLGPVAAVASRLSILTSSVQNTVGSVTTLGGVLPSNPISTSVGNMAAQLTANTQYPILINMGNITQRISKNVTNANLQSSTRTVQVAGGTLFDVAASQYGDATQWAAIARASGLTDPAVVGVQTVTIPANPASSGGVLAP